MRERTTWNREQIAKLAAGGKVADDPRAMNQDHLKQQPAADKYVIGEPSDFAEDVHPSANTWKAEYSGGEVKRDEIGLPEMRNDTFNHPEKTAADQQGQDDEDDDFLQKKADVCINLAKRMLGKNASEQALEDQALAFMHLPDAAIVATATRIADQQDGDEGQSQQEQKQAQQQDDKDQEQKQAQQQNQTQEESEEQKQAAKKAQQDDKGQQAQDKEAGQIPENFLKNKDKKEDGDEGGDEQKKQAGLDMYSQQACEALMKGDRAAAEQAVQQMVQMSQGQQQPMMSQDQAKQQVQDMFAQAMQQMQQQPTMADDQLLDQMLQQQQPAQQQMMAAAPTASAPSMDIELQSASVDIGDVKLGSEDEALTALFASHSEVREAAQASAILTGVPAQTPAPMTRTASTRTVGTRPTGGVAQLGGGTSGEDSSNAIDKLSGLWASAPDVSSVFSS